jgi:hypothetical protein
MTSKTVTRKHPPTLVATTQAILRDWNVCWQLEDALRAIMHHQKPEQVNPPAVTLRLAQAALRFLLNEDKLPLLRPTSATPTHHFNVAVIVNTHGLHGHVVHALYAIHRAAFGCTVFHLTPAGWIRHAIRHLDCAIVELDPKHEWVTHEHH